MEKKGLEAHLPTIKLASDWPLRCHESLESLPEALSKLGKAGDSIGGGGGWGGLPLPRKTEPVISTA